MKLENSTQELVSSSPSLNLSIGTRAIKVNTHEVLIAKVQECGSYTVLRFSRTPESSSSRVEGSNLLWTESQKDLNRPDAEQHGRRNRITSVLPFDLEHLVIGLGE